MSDVLVVDDDEDLRTAIALFLQQDGHVPRTAGDGAEALVRVEEKMPDLILLDMRMRGMNGWDFGREFRLRYGRAAPIVVVTAAADAYARAQEIDAEGWLGKPFDLDQLLETVVRLARRAEAPPEAR